MEKMYVVGLLNMFGVIKGWQIFTTKLENAGLSVGIFLTISSILIAHKNKKKTTPTIKKNNINMMIVLFINIVWILYSMIEGLREGFYWHFKSHSKKNCDFEIHPIFSLQRAAVLSLIGILLYSFIGWQSIISVISMMLIFSFFHNGVYYYTRNKLDETLYPKGWSDQSITSTAKMTNIMTYRNRTIFMIIGVLAQVFMLLFL